MPKASVTRQIAREKQKLINFVLDIEKYPEFIPFCIDSKVYERNDKKDYNNSSNKSSSKRSMEKEIYNNTKQKEKTTKKIQEPTRRIRKLRNPFS